MSYRDVEDDENLSQAQKDMIHADNYDPNIGRLANMTRKQRENAARTFGANWACVVCGFGDQ